MARVRGAQSTPRLARAVRRRPTGLSNSLDTRASPPEGGRSPRARAYPHIDRNLGAVGGRAAAVQRARVLLPVGVAIIEDDRGVGLRAEG
eukprot:5717387-Prymnesium_polylepis.1